MKKIKGRTLLTPTDKTGLLFVFPFIIGFIWLFMKPLLESLNYTFHRVTMGTDSLVLTPIGFENWKYMATTDAEFIKKLITMTSGMLVEILVIMFISIFLAVLLVDKFPGRLFFRTALFLPMIFGAAPIMSAFRTLGGDNEMEAQGFHPDSYILTTPFLSFFITYFPGSSVSSVSDSTVTSAFSASVTACSSSD